MLSKGIRCFDEWASIFGEITTERELTPEGNGYRFRTRFAKFHNVPVLLQMFCEVADIQTADMLQLPVPKLAGGKAQVVVSSPSEELKEFMKQGIERVQSIRNGTVDPSVDNMLKFIGDARRAGLDMRLIGPAASFDPNGKIAKDHGWPSTSQISQGCGISNPRVRQAVKTLAGMLLISKAQYVKQCGAYGHNHFQVIAMAVREALLKVYRKHKRQSIAEVLWTAFLFLCRWLAVPVLEPADLLPSLLRAKPGKHIFLRI